MNHSIKFIDYTGKWPNLCRGTLTVDIDGDWYNFGTFYDKDGNPEFNDRNFPPFWESGGDCRFDEDYNAKVTTGPWRLDLNEKLYPDFIVDLMPRLIEIFNENVINGCCGGCI